MCQKDCYHGPVNYLPMYVNKQILCNYNVDCNPEDFLFEGTDHVAVTFYPYARKNRNTTSFTHGNTSSSLCFTTLGGKELWSVYL